MYKYTITFLALTDTISFDVNSPDKELIEEFVQKLLLIFARVDTENEKVIVESFQQNNPDNREKINEFVDEFKEQLPQLNAVSAYFRKLKENEHFFFLPNIKFEQKENYKLYDYLRAIADGVDFEQSEQQFEELFGALFDKYHVKAVGPKRILIGERNKEKRVCRFCSNTKEPLSFNNEAHAISEGLGNKTVILLEECDQCNDQFSKDFEPDIIQYLSLFRTFFDVKGKGGSKKFKGDNFELKNDENIELKLYSTEDRPEEPSMPYKVKLETKEPLSLQNIYKSLCKFYLSVIDTKYLPEFSETIKWINGDRKATKLPKIGELISYHGFTKQPKLVTYIRKDQDTTLPFAVGEFYFTCKIIVFILPLTKQDEKDFISEPDYEKFWETFQHFKKTDGWAFKDFSNDTKRKLTLNLNFQQEKKE